MDKNLENYQKIIFVCTDNICQGIIAEAIFKSLDYPKKVEVCSRGTVVLIPEPMNPKAVAVLKSHQLEPSKEYSQELTKDDLTMGTLILTMTQAQSAAIIDKYPESLRTGRVKISTIREFIGQEGDITDPSGALTEYGMFFEHIDLLVKVIVEKLFKEDSDSVLNKVKEEKDILISQVEEALKENAVVIPPTEEEKDNLEMVDEKIKINKGEK